MVPKDQPPASSLHTTFKKLKNGKTLEIKSFKKLKNFKPSKNVSIISQNRLKCAK